MESAIQPDQDPMERWYGGLSYISKRLPWMTDPAGNSISPSKVMKHVRSEDMLGRVFRSNYEMGGRC